MLCFIFADFATFKKPTFCRIWSIGLKQSSRKPNAVSLCCSAAYWREIFIVTFIRQKCRRFEGNLDFKKVEYTSCRPNHVFTTSLLNDTPPKILIQHYRLHQFCCAVAEVCSRFDPRASSAHASNFWSLSDLHFHLHHLKHKHVDIYRKFHLN